MANCISSSDLITPAWLTGILRQQVTHLEKDCSSPFGATVCRLTLTYTGAAPALAPQNLFMKLLPGGDGIHARGKRDVQFYQMMMNSDSRLPVPTCYHAAYDAHTGAVNLLLEDLSDTHQPLEHEIPPTESQSYQLVEALATLHAFWWDSPQLGDALGEPPSETNITNDFAEDAAAYRTFADALGNHLLPSHRANYERVIDRLLPVKLRRFADRRNVTLSHGDAHAWNFLYPKVDGGFPVLVDWEALSVNVGPNDLAYLMTIFWHPARRNLLEQSLVKHYQEQLTEHGITDYTWDDCWTDYRLSVINHLFMPAWWWRFKMPAYLWWYRMERLMMAYQDLGCAELLD